MSDTDLLKSARLLLRSSTDHIIYSLPKFAGDHDFLKLVHHAEKMGKARNKVIQAINRLRFPDTAEAPTKAPRAKTKNLSKTKRTKAGAPPEPTLPMTDSHHTIFQLSPHKLKLAPELAAVPMTGAVVEHYRDNPKAATVRDELDAERRGTQASLDDIGIQEPLKVTLSADGTKGKVWDGRHRLEWALARGKDTVPVIHVTEEVGRKLMEASVIGRRHWTKGQRAYLGVICHPEIAGLTAGRPRKSAEDAPVTATALAERLGISADTVSQAVALYKVFHAPEAKAGSAEAIEAADRRGKYEMSIWAGAGLGGLLAGIGGGEATKDKPLGTMTRLSHLWDQWEPGDRTKALRLMTTRFKDEFSPAFRLALSEALAAADEAI